MAKEAKKETLSASQTSGSREYNCLVINSKDKQAGIEAISTKQDPSHSLLTLRTHLFQKVQKKEKVCREFQEILIQLFDCAPRFIETEEGDDLTFVGGTQLRPLTDEAYSAAIDIHFRLLESHVPYDEFLFTNIIQELERRTNTGDPKAHALLAHYDDLYHKLYSK
jgi:hypothetical protein